MNASAPASRRRRVLVVDDEVGPRESIRMLLKPLYEVETADSALAGLGALAAFRPDVVVLDIKMPEIDGLEALRRIKRVDPTIEVVMITAYASLETVRMALRHGAFEYLTKPFSRHDLESVVRRAAERREAALDTRDQIKALVEDMRRLTVKTYALEEAARREAAHQSLRITQLSLLREIARGVVRQLDTGEVTKVVTEHLQRALGYDAVTISTEPAAALEDPGSSCVFVCPIQDADGRLGHLVVDNTTSGHAIDAPERELLEMLSEYLAVALRNAHLYGEIANTKRSLEQLIASAGEGIITVDTEDRIEGWNPAAERIFGQTASEVHGRRVTDFVAGANYVEAKARLAAGATTHPAEFTVSVNGRQARLAATLSALRDRPGGLGRLIVIVRDITSQRELEAQLHQSEKLRALGQLAGGIAHDFNNLLQAILGYAQLLKENPGRSELAERSLRVIEAAALDGSETVRSIQQFARLRPDEEFVLVDLGRVVRDAVAITRPHWDEKVVHDNQPLRLALSLAPEVRIKGRPAALTEMMTNLVLNAIDAMPFGGTLTIGTATEGHVVRAWVTDTGIGMPESIRRRIFEPFFSTKGEGGSGLGLAMAYSIVTRHGGTIDVASQPGQGTSFTLTFPAAGEDDATTSPSAARPGRRRARVLLVDDNEQVRGTLGDLLESLGHSVQPAASGALALAAYAPGRFDAVMTNLGMPGMTGWELIERLRVIDPLVPVFLVTGWGLRDDQHQRLAALRVQRALYKPVRPAELDAAIQAALASAAP